MRMSKKDLKFDVRKEVKHHTLIHAFPGVGFVSMIASNFMIEKANFERVGVVTSPKFPATSVVHEGHPYTPVRLYGNDSDILIMVSEFAPKSSTARMIGDDLLYWAKKSKLDRIISLESIMVKDIDEQEKNLFAVGSTDGARETIESAEIEVFEEGMVSGVAGALLGEAEWTDFDIICLLVDAHPMYPDARAASKILEALNTIFPSLDLDLEELLEQADEIEENLQDSIQKAKQYMAAQQDQEPGKAVERPPLPYMYG